jgi:hypothetical protein
MKARGPAEWDQVPYMACGARDVEVTRPGWAEGLLDWLRFGGRWRPPRRVCRRCGNPSDWRSFATLGPLPARLVVAARPADPGGAPAAHDDPEPGHLPGGGGSRGGAGGRSPAAVRLAVVAAGRRGRGRRVAVLLLHRAVGRQQIRPAACHRPAAGGPPAPGHRTRPRAGGQAVPGRPLPPVRPAARLPGPRQLGGWEGGWAKGQRPSHRAQPGPRRPPLAEKGPQLRVEVRAEHIDTEQAKAVGSGAGGSWPRRCGFRPHRRPRIAPGSSTSSPPSAAGPTRPGPR